MDQQFYCPIEKMQSAGLSDAAVKGFQKAYRKVQGGADELIRESSIKTVDGVKKFEDLDVANAKELESIINESVVIKLNGGLGTSMGLNTTKSLLEVREGLAFLDVIAKQVMHIRHEHHNDLKFLLMNSFSTTDETRDFLLKYPELGKPAEIELLQNRIPKIDANTFEAVNYEDSRDLEWCPPGHGDVYATLLGTGVLDELVDSGVRYAFISNSDNLGATFDFNLLSEFKNSGASFMMEVTRRTGADKKGGHLAKDSQSGNLLLREVAQCPDEDLEDFQNISKYRYFNTNNIWLRLDRLRDLMQDSGGFIDLPLIVNRKNINPVDPESTKVIQIEVAMGAAIQCFKDSTVIEVPRTRFSPVKSCEDLFALRSDAYHLGENFQIQLIPERYNIPPIVKLNDGVYKNYQSFEKMTNQGVPSLKNCESIHVNGPLSFSSNIEFKGRVSVINSSGSIKKMPPGRYEDQEVVLQE